MVERARQRAARERVAHLVEFRVADARTLPFEDHLFDVVIGESVVAFLQDKQRAVDECARVTKPGGFVGLTEATLLKPTPSAEFMQYLSEAAGMVDAMLPQEEWAAFLYHAGLRDVMSRSYRLDLRREAIARLERYPMRDTLAALARLPRAYLRGRSSKQFLRQALGGARYLTEDILEYMGYGIYAGKK
jgi:SAM-dependent methyltransferase